MILYLDTSSLLKLFIGEPDSDAVRTLVNGAESSVTSRVAYAESRAALARAKSQQRLDDTSYIAALREFENRWDSMMVIELTGPNTRHAGDLAERHLLRGFDAIHLAAALVVRSRAPGPTAFSSADSQLRAAALKEGLRVP